MHTMDRLPVFNISWCVFTTRHRCHGRVCSYCLAGCEAEAGEFSCVGDPTRCITLNERCDGNDFCGDAFDETACG